MNQSEASSSATEDELIVAQILLDLRKRMSLSESLAGCNWGCRRKRSCPDEDPPLRRKSKAEKGAAAASPTTPLSFSPSESDEKPEHSYSKASKKRAREIEVLLQNRDVLRGGIENARNHYDKLKAYNSELKAIKYEVINKKFPREEDARVEPRGGRSDDLISNTAPPHLQPLIADPTAEQRMPEYPIGSIRTRFCDGVGPLGIDLNMPPVEDLGEGEPLDVIEAIEDKRARFAEARKKRRGLMRAKSMKSRSNHTVKLWQQVDTYSNWVL